MTTRAFSFAPGEFYHIYNRGTDKRDIYTTSVEYEVFKELLYLANSSKPIDRREINRQFESVFDWDRGEELVAIGAYCLMPNHFHLLTTPVVNKGISLFMNRLGTSYSMYFNKRHDRTGSLFEGKFKAKWVDSDEYLKYLYSYIHLNPVKLRYPNWKEMSMLDPDAVYEYASSYKYSSLHTQIQGDDAKILSQRYFPNYFPDAVSNKKQLIEWLTYEKL